MTRASPYQISRRSDDSPSRKVEYDLERAFNQVHLHHAECQKLDSFQRRQQQEELDAKEMAQAEAHRKEMSHASAQHELVRQQAEAVLRSFLKKEEEERRRREEERRRQEEEEERRRQEAEAARRRAEQERREREERERRERTERAETEERERAEKERLRKQRAEAEENQRKEREATEQAERLEREQKEKSDRELALKQQQLAATQNIQTQAATSSAVSGAQITQNTSPASLNQESEHKHYLAIHRKLKAFRKEFWASSRKNPTLKPHVGDMRRTIKTCIGQLTDDKAGNKVPVSYKLHTALRIEMARLILTAFLTQHERIRTILLRALKEIPSSPVMVNEYLPPGLSLLDKGQTTIPELLLYLLSMFSKAVMNAFVGECAVNTKAAEPIGTLAAQIFSMPELQFQRNVPSVNSGIHYEAFGGSTATPPMKPSSCSLIAVLMCKFHAAAPILFGISGSESTTAGKLRIGWRTEPFSDDKKAFVEEQKQYDRLIGLGVGYASIALRNFARSRLINPWPPRHYWTSLASIANTPPAEVQTSHLILLKSMLENIARDRFVLFYGAAGIAALRQAVVSFPASLPREMQEKPAARALTLVAEGWNMGWD